MGARFRHGLRAASSTRGWTGQRTSSGGATVSSRWPPSGSDSLTEQSAAVAHQMETVHRCLPFALAAAACTCKTG